MTISHSDRKEIQNWLMDIEINWLNKYPVISNEAGQFVDVVRLELANQILEYRKLLEDF